MVGTIFIWQGLSGILPCLGEIGHKADEGLCKVQKVNAGEAEEDCSTAVNDTVGIMCQVEAAESWRMISHCR